MSKFNTNTSGSMKTTNHEGGQAYKLTEKQKLMTMVLTSYFNENKFYGDNSKEIVETLKNVINQDPVFVANLAIFTRKEMFLRTLPQVIIGEMANHVKGKPFVRRTIQQAVQRVDDMTELLAYYINNYGKPVPNSLKKGLADVFFNFDGYQLAKYNRDSKAVKLKDVLGIVHPKPKTPEQSALFDKVMNDTLETPYTWETEVSAKGNKKEVWEELVDSKRLGYMATLRNLRNMVNTGISNINDVINYIQNPNAVKNSKQLPYRYYSAYKELQNLDKPTNKLLDAIEKAIEISADNLPKLEGRTLLISDNSGSMQDTLSNKGTVTYQDVATLMMSVSNKFCTDAVTSVFGTKFQLANVSQYSGILNNMNTFKSIDVGYGTELWTAFEWLLNSGEHFDRIIIFSDMQCYDSNSHYFAFHRIQKRKTIPEYLEQYKQQVNPDIWVHSIDLAGYGTAQFMGKNVNLIAGWNDKVLQYISLAEAGETTLLKQIEGYYFK